MNLNSIDILNIFKINKNTSHIFKVTLILTVVAVFTGYTINNWVQPLFIVLGPNI